MDDGVEECPEVNVSAGGEAEGDPPCPRYGRVVVDVEEGDLFFCFCRMRWKREMWIGNVVGESLPRSLSRPMHFKAE